MVNFKHTDAGTPESHWMASNRWTSLPHLDPATIEHLVVVSAHPDDETLGTAGLMHRVAHAGGHICVILATDGEASHSASVTHSPDQMGFQRVAEVRQALEQIAPGISLVRLGLHDGALKHSIPQLREAIRAVVTAIDGPITLASTWSDDGHGDHRAVSEASAEVARETGARLLEYPIWMWHWAAPDDHRVPWSQLTVMMLDSTEQAAKVRAIAEYRSQTRPLSNATGDEAILHAGFLEHFTRPMEAFVEAHEHPHDASLARKYFEDFYADKADPWGFETRWYEQRKRAITMASLPRERFGRALEIGCSIGVLTEHLAARCDEVLATDIASQPLKIAQRRLRDQPHVNFEQVAVHHSWPAGSFDLIVLSEVGYYLSPEALDLVIRNAARSLTLDGILLACHWRHPVSDYPLTGDQVHAQLQQAHLLSRLARHEEEDFLLEVYGRSSALSVARQTGLV